MTSNKIWNTGVDDHGSPLALNSIDPHWTLAQAAGVTFLTPQPVYVLANQHHLNYFNKPDSMWVWANPSGAGIPTPVSTYMNAYVYQCKFYVEVNLSHRIRISGEWGADNFGQFTIDGYPLPPGCGIGETSLPPGNIASNYQMPHAFTITQGNAFTWTYLHFGWHTLDVWVYNEGQEKDPSVNPAGFNLSAMRIDIYAVPIPVPHGIR